ncbi:Bicaudal D-related protein [Blattella germanica]|nr:Bicaudal D-related protein [Blattella germanica]
MSEKKCELERRLQSLLSERESLGSALDEATDRIVMLEHQAREQEIQLRQAHREMEELRSTNGSLGERIEMLSAHSTSPGPRSLLHEMECDDTNSESDLITHSDFSSNDGIRKEVWSAYQQLRTIIDRLKHSRGDSIGSDLESMPSEELSPSKLKVGLLSEILSVREAELKAMKEERDTARMDLDGTQLARDEVVRKAWDVRDAAVARKNAVEVELAKTRIDVMQANSQLMEAIQQKVELSQQLEQWQMDMQSLLDDQMKSKLCSQERARQANKMENKQPTTRRLFGLFQR